jgi:hypothetical protein
MPHTPHDTSRMLPPSRARMKALVATPVFLIALGLGVHGTAHAQASAPRPAAPATPAKAATPAKQDQRFPDIIGVKVRVSAPDTFDFDVTVSSPYDTPSRYADAFRVMAVAAPGATATIFGERILLHDHQDEQPFSRDLYGVKIPRGTKTVVVQGRDQKFGYGGKTFQLDLPGR